MFKNIGNKIKGLAKVLIVVGIVISSIYGILVMLAGSLYIPVGFLVIILGSLASWVNALLIYGFGEVINQLEYSNAYNKRIYHLLNKKESVTTDSVNKKTEDISETSKTE